MESVPIFVDICRLCGCKQRGNINICENKEKNKRLMNEIRTSMQIDIARDDPLPKSVCKACCKQLDSFRKFRNCSLQIQDKLMNDYLAIVETSAADDNDVLQTVIVNSDLASDELLNRLVEENHNSLATSELATEIEIYADGNKQLGTVSSIVKSEVDTHTLSLHEVQSETLELRDMNDEVVGIVNSGVPSDGESLSMNIPTYVVLNNEDGPITLYPVNTLPTTLTNAPPNKVPIPRLTKENRCDPSVFVMLESDMNIEEPKTNQVPPKPKRTRVTSKVIRVPASKSVRRLVKKVSSTEYRCILCGTTFPQNYLCEYHVRTHTGEMPFKCTVCGKSFVAMHMLTKHKQSHETGVRQLCGTCGRGFRSISNLRCHEKMHLDAPAPFSCEICGKAFYFRASYSGHLETHVARRDHTCDRCAKSYKTRRHLKEHVARIHEGVTRHMCPTCGKCFYRHTTYRQHLRLHTSERPYSCDICGRAFNERTNLKRHRMIHDKKKRNNSGYIEVQVETVVEPPLPLGITGNV